MAGIPGFFRPEETDTGCSAGIPGFSRLKETDNTGRIARMKTGEKRMLRLE